MRLVTPTDYAKCAQNPLAGFVIWGWGGRYKTASFLVCTPHGSDSQSSEGANMGIATKHMNEGLVVYCQSLCLGSLWLNASEGNSSNRGRMLGNGCTMQREGAIWCR